MDSPGLYNAPSRPRIVARVLVVTTALALVGAVVWGTNEASVRNSALTTTAVSSSAIASTGVTGYSSDTHAQQVEGTTDGTPTLLDSSSSTTRSSSEPASLLSSHTEQFLSEQNAPEHVEKNTPREGDLPKNTSQSETLQESNREQEFALSSRGSETSAPSPSSTTNIEQTPNTSTPEESAKPAASTEESLVEVLVVLDSSNAHAYDARYPTSLGEFTVSIARGSSVYDALVATGVSYSLKGPNYIASIGGLAERNCGAGSGWLYLVNNEMPMKPAASYLLEGGEVVRWAYTIEKGDV